MAELPVSSAALFAQPGLGGAAAPKLDAAHAKDSATDFEAFFLSQMLGTMFQGISTDGPFGGGHAEEVYRSMLIDQYGKLIAKTGRVGIADSVMAEILKTQEV